MFLVKFGAHRRTQSGLWIFFLPQVSDAQIILGSMLADAINGFPCRITHVVFKKHMKMRPLSISISIFYRILSTRVCAIVLEDMLDTRRVPASGFRPSTTSIRIEENVMAEIKLFPGTNRWYFSGLPTRWHGVSRRSGIAV